MRIALAGTLCLDHTVEHHPGAAKAHLTVELRCCRAKLTKGIEQLLVVSYQVENLGNVSKKETQALNVMEDVLEDARNDVRIAPYASEPRKLPLHIST